MNNGKDIEKMLRNMHPRLLSKEESNMLWESIERKLGEKTRAGSPNTFNLFALFSKKAVVAASLILALGGGSIATVAAADRAIPGDLLFPVDIAAERVRIAIAPKAEKDLLRIKFAEERLYEAKQAIEEFNADTLALENVTLASATTTFVDGETATSTPGGADTATSTDPVARPPATSTPPGNGGTGLPNGTEDKIKHTNAVISIALDHLESTKARLVENGDDAAVAVIEDIIGELKALTEKHISRITEFEARIKVKENKTKLEINVLSDDLKTKFKFSEKTSSAENEAGGNNNGDGGTGDNNENANDPDNDEPFIKAGNVKISKDGLSKKLKIKAGGVRVEFNQKGTDISVGDEGGSNGHDDRNNKGENKHKIKVCHIGAGSHKQGRTIKVSASSARAHLAHGDTLGECDDDSDKHEDKNKHEHENDDHEDENDGHHEHEHEDEDNDDHQDGGGDITAPVISNLSSLAGTTTAEISWSTDENADSTLWYNVTSPVDTASSTHAYSASPTTNHSLALSGLTASTTYYYIAVSKDAAGNTATSSEKSFETLSDVVPEPPDETAPVISGITATDIGTTTASVSWTTDEPATSDVWFGLASPITLASSTSATEGGLVTSHIIGITGLTASSTYYYVVVSEDASGNAATSTEHSFLTL